MDTDTIIELSRLYAIKITLALLIFIVGKWVVRKLANTLSKILERQLDVTVARFLSNLAYATGVTVVIIAALGQLGVQTASDQPGPSIRGTAKTQITFQYLMGKVLHLLLVKTYSLLISHTQSPFSKR